MSSTFRKWRRRAASARESWRAFDPQALSPSVAYAFAAVATLATLALRVLAFDTGDPPLVILFVIPIVLSALIGGVGPGLLATALAALVVPYFLLVPLHSFSIANTGNRASMLALIAIGVLVSVLSEALYRSRRTLAASERMSAVTLASIGDAVITTDVDGRVMFVNAEAERLTGWSPAEAAGQPLATVLRIVHADSREPLADPVPQILHAAAPVNLARDVELIARDGRELAIDDSGAPIRGPDGAARGVVIVFRDCSARRAAEHALRESEERLRLAQDVVGIGVFDLDIASGRHTWTASQERLYGVARGTFGGRYEDWRCLVHPDDIDGIEGEWKRVVAAHEPLDYEFRIVTPGGETRWIATKGVTFYRDDGTPHRLLGINLDISDRKRSEEQVRRAYDVLTLAQRASHSGVWDYDFQSRSGYCSPEYCALYGLPPGTAFDRDAWLERVHLDDRERMREAARKLLADGSEWNVEFRIVHPTLRERWLASRGTLTRDRDGAPMRFTGADMDITGHRLAQDALRAGEMRFRSYVEDAPVAMFVASPNARIVDCNPAAAELLGYDAAALRGMPSGQLIAHDDRATAAQAFEALVRRGRIAGEFRAMPRDGRELWVSIRGVRLADGHLMAFCTDVTARRRAEKALQESETRFRQLIESLPQLVWTCTAEGDCDYVNPQWVAYTGVDVDAPQGAAWLGAVHADDRPALIDAWTQARERGAEFRREFRIRRYDGVHRWFDGRAVPLRDEAGGIVKWFGIDSDIHEARELRETLRQEKERFAQLAAAAPGVVHTFAIGADRTPRFRYASPGIADIYGIDAQTLARDASVAFDRVHPDDAPRVAASIAESARTMTAWRQEFRVLHPDKGEIWIEGHSAPVREPEDTVVWHGILHDITERKRMEEALRTSRSQLLAALDAGGMGAWMWDVAKDRFTWDESVLRVLGIDADEAAQTNLAGLLELVHASDRESVRASFESLLRDGTDAAGEYRIAQSDGSTRWIAYTARLERDAAQRPARVIGINVDITHRKRAEEAQLRSQKLEALGTLAGGIAHDFNNILVAITGNTKLAKSDLPRGHPAQESLDEIARAGARAVDLVRRILAFSRPYDHKREVLALAPVVDEALKLVRASLPAMVQIRTHFDAQLPPVSIDPTQIHQIIVNLATNASHAIGAGGGHIEVRVEAVVVDADLASHTPGLAEGHHVRLEVADDGCGMDAATLERIFDPFFTTKPQGLGTGLGLSVVHGLVKSHDGAISVTSEIGRGTTFRLYFPAVETSAERALRAQSSPRMAHILFVDDEAPLVMLVSRMLERIGYRVTGITDASQALAQFRAHPHRFDAVVTDLAMVGMSGFDLARDMLALRPDLPIVMTSGYIHAQEQQAAAALGVRALIVKPDTVEELGYVLNRVLQQRAERIDAASVDGLDAAR